MLGLAYGFSGSTAIRNRHGVVPIPWFFRTDAGPNTVVVCSDGDFEDLALVWNLRSAHGDSRPFPLGIPRSLASKELLSELSVHSGLSHQGGHTRLYITSVSVPVSELQELVADLPGRAVTAVGYESLLSFGVAAGRSHEDGSSSEGVMRRLSRYGMRPRGRMRWASLTQQGPTSASPCRTGGSRLLRTSVSAL